QRRAGYDVFGSQVTVSIDRAGKVIFAGGSLMDGLSAGSTDATLGAADAVRAAADALKLDDPENLTVTSKSAQKAVLSGAGISASPNDAKIGWQRTGDGSLRLAWQVLIDDASDSHLWNAKVDARSGTLLHHEDLTVHDDMGDIVDSVARERDISKNIAPPAF